MCMRRETIATKSIKDTSVPSVPLCPPYSPLHAQSTTPLPPFTGSHRSSYCYKLVLFSKSYIIEPYRRDFAFAFYKQTDVVLFTCKITLKFPPCRSKCLCQTVFHSLDAVGMTALAHPFIAWFPVWGCYRQSCCDIHVPVVVSICMSSDA